MNTTMRDITRLILSAVVVLGLSGMVWAATPPGLLNYQGVLRDASGAPEDDAFEMVFAFYDTDGGAPPCPAAGGTLLLTDSQPGVPITGGLFNVQLGGGAITPGSEGSLAEVFRDNAAVYLEVMVAGEVLCPRVQVISAAYSLNADHLDGKDAAEFIDTSANPQTKAGDLTVAGNVTLTAGTLEFPDGSVQTSAVNSLPPDTCFDNVGRFVVCGDGAVKDNLTGLFWLENASCFGPWNWDVASIAAAQLGDGQCGLTDGSSPGDWRLPTAAEWQVIADQAIANGCVFPGPVVPDTFGTGCWSEGDPFAGVLLRYWSSTTIASNPGQARIASLLTGFVGSDGKSNLNYGWPVRSGP